MNKSDAPCVDWGERKTESSLYEGPRSHSDQSRQRLLGIQPVAAAKPHNVGGRLRAKAQAVGSDLVRPFFFTPDDPRFDQILTQVKRERDARIARLRRDRKKYAVAKQQQHRENIAEPPRLKEFNYPPVMREIFAATSIAR
jgi:hypothetical protein